MPAINFTVFVDKVESGEKCQTIWQPRLNPIKKGDSVYLYTGMRTKNARKLGTGVVTEVTFIKIDAVLSDDGKLIEDQITIYLEGISIIPIAAKKLAMNDGFANLLAFAEFFNTKYGLPFFGYLIEWRLK